MRWAVIAAMLLQSVAASADDAIWARDEQTCKQLGPSSERRCLERATLNRGARMLESRNAGQDPQFDRELATCTPLSVAEFPGCYRRALEGRDERAIAAADARIAAEKASVAQKSKARSARHATTAGARSKLAGEYQRLLEAVFPNHNFIKVAVVPQSEGFALLGEHSMFTRYSFDFGPAGPTVQAWASERSADLRAAEINRVGIRSDWGNTFFGLK